MPKFEYIIVTHNIQGRHGEFEPGKAQYSTPNIFDRLFLIRVYWNPKSRQGPGLGGLASRGGPDIYLLSTAQAVLKTEKRNCISQFCAVVKNPI